MSDSIPKQVVASLGQVVSETVEKTGENAVAAVESVIRGEEWVAGAKSMSEQKMAEESAIDRQKTEAEIAALKDGMQQGRNVGQEIEHVREEKEQKKKEEEEFLAKLAADRRREREEQAAMMAVMETGNPMKAKKRRGSAFVPAGKQKASTASMTQTGEFSGGKVD